MYSVHITARPQRGVPELRATFGRVTVLLGANGSGKSRLLTELRDDYRRAFGENRPVVFIEGGRVVPIPDSLKLDKSNVSLYSHYATALQQHQNKRSQKLADRIRDALFTLARRTEEDKTTHSDAVDAWMKGGQKGPCPKRDEPPLDRLFRLFAEVLPQIRLEVDQDSSVRSVRNGQRYQPSGMSDGEKQTLAILADIAMLADPNSLIIVDEPELNLHPLLAVRLWTAIEADFPNAIFVYATHSIGFAMRREVNQVIVVSSQTGSLEVGDPSSLDPAELRPFLGCIPAILTAERAIIVEGDDSSFDALFYGWVVGQGVEVIPLGNCSDVQAATSRCGVWRRLAPAVKLLGLIDRDYKSDEVLARLKSDRCTPVDLHEAESYLCFPSLLSVLAERAGLMEQPVTEAVIEGWVRAFGEEVLGKLAAQRAFSRATISLSVSLPRQALAAVKDDTQMLSLLKQECQRETKKAQDKLSEQELERIYREELANCRKALKGSMEDALRVLPGKQLLESVAPRLGFKSARQLLVAARKHIKPEEFPVLARLRGLLLSTLGCEPPDGGAKEGPPQVVQGAAS